MAERAKIEMGGGYYTVAPPDQEAMVVAVVEWNRLIDRLKRSRDSKLPWLFPVSLALLGFGGAAGLAGLALSEWQQLLAFFAALATVVAGTLCLWFSRLQDEGITESIESIVDEMDNHLRRHRENVALAVMMANPRESPGWSATEFARLVTESSRRLIDRPSTGPLDPET